MTDDRYIVWVANPHGDWLVEVDLRNPPDWLDMQRLYEEARDAYDIDLMHTLEELQGTDD